MKLKRDKTQLIPGCSSCWHFDRTSIDAVVEKEETKLWSSLIFGMFKARIYDDFVEAQHQEKTLLCAT